ALTVTGLFPSVTGFTSSGQPGNWTLTATVGGNATVAPTGTVSFLNANADNTVISTGTLGNGSGTPGAAGFIRMGYFSNLLIGPAVIGDFNGDGRLDIAGIVNSYSDNFATVMLGDETGNFTAAAGTNLGSQDAAVVAEGDFNGDGVLDLAVGGQGTVTILLGNGDGTFKQGQTLAMAANVSSMVAADLNGDGIVDLALLSPSLSRVLVYVGNGDGTFTASTLAPPSTGSNAFAVVAGDFNGDGIPDLAVSGATLEVFLGNGDGTFASTITNPQSGGFMIACDFNGDGKLDLAVANAPASVAILLDDGHGNFSTATDVEIGGALGAEFIDSPTYIACGDFNGNGKTDLIINDPIGMGTTSAVAYGNGDGTFGMFTPISGMASVVAVGDFNSDGPTDLVTEEAPFMSVTQTATVTSSGIAVTPGTGSQLAVASYSGDSNYKPGSSIANSLQAAQAMPTAKVTASATSIVQGQPVVLTATVTSSGLTPTGTVTFYDGSALLAAATLNSGGIATYSTMTLAPGTNSITASYGGDVNNLQVNSAALVVTVTPPGTTPSTVTVSPASASAVAWQPLAVPITVSGAAGGAAPTGMVNLATGTYSAWQPLSGGTVTFTLPAGTLSSGANTLTASYPGDGVYAAGMATSTVTVPQVLIAIPAPTPVSAGGSATATVTLSSGSTYSGTLKLTCALTTSPSGAQSLPTCAMNPISLAITSGGMGTSVLMVKTTAASTTALHKASGRNFWRIGGRDAVFALLLVFGVGWRRRRWTSMVALLSILVVGAVFGCGGSSPSGSTGSGTLETTSGNYTFTVTGTDASNASITAAMTVTVTVQ
ncbi:MAG: FG-GAP-like repeat-containing protein, partial [Terracidiphilus sp.]